jgi:hypothetical protein
MSAATRRCDRIISLIDECLADADEAVRSTPRPSPSRSAASESAWLRMAPAGHLLRESAFAIAR